MSTTNWIQLVVTLGVLFGCAPFLSKYMARVFDGEHHILSFLSPVERWIYRVSGIRSDQEMNWKQYLAALLALNALGFLFVWAVLMTQKWLPLNPAGIGNMSWHLALNTAVSFMTNTNWQAYSGEASASYFSQMVGLAVQNFLSAATGIAVLLAIIRGIRNRPKTGEVKLTPGTALVGNFWVDLTRSTLYVLLPLSLILATVLISQGVVQSFSGYVHAVTLKGRNKSSRWGRRHPRSPSSSWAPMAAVSSA